MKSLFLQFQRADHGIVVILVVLAAISFFLFGCKNHGNDILRAGSPVIKDEFVGPTKPTEFINQIASTEYIILTNRFSGEYPTNENLSIKLTGKQVKNILKAISLLESYPNAMGSASCWDLQLQFFHGRNCLGKANFQGSSVVLDAEYCDRTGTLEKLYRENRDKLLPSFLREIEP